MKNKGVHLQKTWFLGTENKVFDGFGCPRMIIKASEPSKVTYLQTHGTCSLQAWWNMPLGGVQEYQKVNTWVAANPFYRPSFVSGACFFFFVSVESVDSDVFETIWSP